MKYGNKLDMFVENLSDFGELSYDPSAKDIIRGSVGSHPW
jgi:hypothetical protein